MFEQLSLFATVGVHNVEAQVQALLARRRAHNTSGQAGEDISLIRAAFAARDCLTDPSWKKLEDEQ